MDTLLQGLLALGGDMAHSPHAAAEPVGLPYKFPQNREHLGEPGNIKPAQQRRRWQRPALLQELSLKTLFWLVFPLALGA